jgi:Xaa-Pro aminopeptidase
MNKHFFKQLCLTALTSILLYTSGYGQSYEWNTSKEIEERPLFSTHFSVDEFASRQAKVFDTIGSNAIAVLQGAPSAAGYLPFWQNNEFYYLSGISSPHAYLVLDGTTQTVLLFLRPRDDRREYGEGKVLSAEDSTMIYDHAAIDEVYYQSDFEDVITRLLSSDDIETVYTPFSPYEGIAGTRSMLSRAIRDMESDTFTDQKARHELFISKLKGISADKEVRDLDPVIDELRKIKSEKEMELIKRSTDLQAAVIMESMRSTEVGIKPYELEAVSKYIYIKNNIQDDAYYPLIHFGPDAYMNHYHESVRPARDGDMILMDYGAYVDYYSSDLGRMWPVNGTFNPVQRELYTFYLKFYEAILYNIKVGLTPQEVMKNALVEIDQILAATDFSKPVYRKAAEDFVQSYHDRAEDPDMTLGHGVGMSVHDVGNYSVPIEPGMVFVIEPQFRVPEERIYIRLEDMIFVTEDGVEIYSDFLPRDIENIEKIMREPGLLQQYPADIQN